MPDTEPTNAKLFDVPTILTLTTGFVVPPSGMDQLKDLVKFLIGQSPSTITLLAVAKPCREHILATHPDLAILNDKDALRAVTDWDAWAATQIEAFGDELPITPLPTPIPRDAIDDIMTVAEIQKHYAGDDTDHGTFVVDL